MPIQLNPVTLLNTYFVGTFSPSSTQTALSVPSPDILYISGALVGLIRIDDKPARLLPRATPSFCLFSLVAAILTFTLLQKVCWSRVQKVDLQSRGFQPDLLVMHGDVAWRESPTTLKAARRDNENRQLWLSLPGWETLLKLSMKRIWSLGESQSVWSEKKNPTQQLPHSAVPLVQISR